MNAWHFQHDAQSNCRGETALHLAGKQALVDAARRSESFSIPKSSGSTELRDDLGQDVAIEWDIPAENRPVVEAGMEITLAHDVRADVVADLDGRRANLAIEIRVTHEKDALDCQAYRRIDQDALEVDLSGLA